jgi:hypothetical protein
MIKTNQIRIQTLLFQSLPPIILAVTAFFQGSEMSILLLLIIIFSLRKESTSYLQNLSGKTLILFLLIGLSFIFPITNAQRGLIGIGFILILKCFSRKWQISTNSASKMSSILIGFEILYYLLSKFPQRITQFLIYGYDNAFHFSLFRIYATSQQFPNKLNDHWPSDFALFKNYSGGFYAIGSFLSSAITGDTENASKLIAAYFLIVFTIFASIVVMSILTIRSVSTGINTVGTYLWILLASVSSLGILLTNGYPPYLFAVFILLLLVTRLIQTNSLGNFIVWSFVAFHLMLISQPLVSWNLIPWFFFLFVCFSKKLFSFKLSKNEILATFLAICLGLITVFVVKDTAHSFGISTLTAVGGVQPLTWEYWFINLFVLLMLLYLTLFKEKVYISALLVISASTPFIFLVGLSLLKTGSVGYYAIKQGYVWSYLVNLSAVLFYEIQKSQRSTIISGGTPIITKILITASVFVSIQGATTPRVFNGAFMGTFKNVALSSVGSESAWPKFGLDANQLLDASRAANNAKSDCLVYRRNGSFSDLGSRWLNGLSTNNISEACFAVYWNSDSLTNVEIEKRIILSGLDVKIISTQDPR